MATDASGGLSGGTEVRGKVTPPQSAHVRQEANKAVNPAGGHDPQGNPVYTYMQCSGKVYDPEGNLMGAGYSGKGLGLNNPKMEHVPNIGPIPAGFYRVGNVIHNAGNMGKYVLPLTPEGSTVNTLSALVRGGFYWHGENPATPLNSSKGCIVSLLVLRQQISTGALVRVLPCEK